MLTNEEVAGAFAINGIGLPADQQQEPPADDVPMPDEYPESADGERVVDLPATAKAPTAKAPLPPRRLTFTRFSQVLLGTAARYLVKGIIPNVGMVVVWGPPKCGKSFFVFDMVAHVAAGWGYRGRRVKQCSVVYFALEGQEGFTARIEAFRLEHGAADIPFYLSSDRIVLPQDGAAVVKSIREEFPDIRPGIVVLDTLNRSISGSENDPADMGS
jgi:AAA domain